MIKIANYISSGIIGLVALLAIMLSRTFRNKFSLVREEILKVNRQQNNLPQNLVYSVVEIEDRRYFQHAGIDFYSIMRAIYKNISTRRIEGASTIVQQLVRNITNDRKINIKRKINEIMLATLIDKEFSKIEIIFAYLGTYPFSNSKGLSEFCKNENYNIISLSHSESAQIAARLKYPTINKSNYIKYLKRVRTIENATNDIKKFRQISNEQKKNLEIN